MKTHIITSKRLAKSGGIQTVTKSLFEKVFPIYYLEDHADGEILAKFAKEDVALFSGFNQDLKNLARSLKNKGAKVAVFWHFSTSHLVDEDLSKDWNALQDMLETQEIDLFISCKPNLPTEIKQLCGIKGFFIMNNSFASQAPGPKNGIGIYSGSSAYWAKNVATNVWAALLTGKDVDILPYGEDLQRMVKTLHAEDRVTGTASALPHDEFVKRMTSRELVAYCTFAEGAPILPLEALNNGTVCLTGDNHHYFLEDPVLRKYLVVSDVQDATAIKSAILHALENKEDVLERYQAWKTQYDKTQAENFEELKKVLQNL